MANCDPETRRPSSSFDSYTQDLINELCSPLPNSRQPNSDEREEIGTLFSLACKQDLTAPIVSLFGRLIDLRNNSNVDIEELGLHCGELEELARKHQQIDEHMVSIGGRLAQTLPIADG